mmetsp:Transcript_5246/g.14883  ORF Transcript_5246/g.14883 Transcript_5246/m.14883 type:complete len:624 (+) Transcript_5246:87-1958(+)
MRPQKRPAADGFGCCDNARAVHYLRPPWPRASPPRRCDLLPRYRFVAVVMLITLIADGAAAAASASSNPPPATSAPMTEREKYEISRQLAKVDPLARPVSSGDEANNNNNNYTPPKSAGISLPESMGESALIDRETGQIFWQGGPGVLYIGTSSTLSSLGVRHLRATALTLMLVTAALSALAAKLRDMLQTIDVVGPWWQVASVLAKCTILLPRFDTWFVILIAVLYLIEAHCCSTRRYLANALSGPAAVEDYVEGLRQAPPVARWTVRCFHYEQRKSLAWLSFFLRMLLGTDKHRSFESDAADGTGDNGTGPVTSQGPSFLTKKVVTHQATNTYQCVSWNDETTVGLWKRAWSPESTAPFTKLSLCKVLLLSNGKARSDYFTQQTDFVMREGRKDQFAEFSTNIGVEGFKSRVLAVRPTRGGPLSSRFFRLHLFWIFTCLGLTVPYRVWFSRHCDELRVAVIKETFATGKKPKLQSSASWTKWFVRSKESDQATFTDESSKSVVASLRSDFRKRMEELAIYQAEEAEETRETAALLQQELEKELEETAALADKEENKEESTSEQTISPQDKTSQPVQPVDIVQEEKTAAAISQDDEEHKDTRAEITQRSDEGVGANRNEEEV